MRVSARAGTLLCAAALVALSLASCTRIGGPAPIVAYGGSGGAGSRPAQPVQPVNSRPGEIIVGNGDTLYTVARRNSAPMRSIIDANHLQPPYILHVGQHLIVPNVRGYQVQPGDTLAGVARRYGVGTAELVRANSLAPPYTLRTGQLLVLPPDFGAAAVAQALVSAPPIPRDTPAPTALPPSRSGSIETTAMPPPLPSAAPPSASPAPSAAAVVPSPPSPSPTQAALPPAALPPPPPPEPVVQPASLSQPPAPAVVPPEIEPVHSGRFLWPVRGTIVSDFGSKPGGLQNDGINILAPRGTAIRAAEAGVVVYAGNELRGFGNLLLVKHRDGWVTAYAHADELLVHRGEQVRRGQVIGRVGATGGVTSPQLHFEVRKGSRPLNPRDYLGPQTASASP